MPTRSPLRRWISWFFPGHAAPAPPGDTIDEAAGSLVIADAAPGSEPPPLANAAWLTLVEECVALFDELERHRATFDPARQELAEHVCLRVREILQRANVEIIDAEARFDRRRHQPATSGNGIRPGDPIVATLSPGFAVGRRILRRATVRVSPAGEATPAPTPP